MRAIVIQPTKAKCEWPCKSNFWSIHGKENAILYLRIIPTTDRINKLNMEIRNHCLKVLITSWFLLQSTLFVGDNKTDKSHIYGIECIFYSFSPINYLYDFNHISEKITLITLLRKLTPNTNEPFKNFKTKLIN